MQWNGCYLFLYEDIGTAAGVGRPLRWCINGGRSESPSGRKNLEPDTNFARSFAPMNLLNVTLDQLADLFFAFLVGLVEV
jgi:hypothetical protein